MSDQTTAPDAADLDGAVEHAVQFDGPMPGSRIPAAYRDASWLGTTPVDDAAECIGLAFTLAGGERVSLRLDLLSAMNVVATLADGLSGYQNRRSQSAKSSGMPSDAVSTRGDVENV